jgi:hypothetical protein
MLPRKKPQYTFSSREEGLYYSQQAFQERVALDAMSATPGNLDYVFECVFDAPSLTQALKPTDDGDTILDRWLQESHIRVVVPQYSKLVPCDYHDVILFFYSFGRP